MIGRRYYLGIANANTVTIKNFLLAISSLADGPSGVVSYIRQKPGRRTILMGVSPMQN